MNRYTQLAIETADRIAVLNARITKWRGKPLASRIPGIEAELTQLEKDLVTYRGAAKLTQEMYGR